MLNVCIICYDAGRVHYNGDDGDVGADDDMSLYEKILYVDVNNDIILFDETGWMSVANDSTLDDAVSQIVEKQMVDSWKVGQEEKFKGSNVFMQITNMRDVKRQAQTRMTTGMKTFKILKERAVRRTTMVKRLAENY